MDEDQILVPRSLDTPNGRLYAEWSLLLNDLRDCLVVAELWQSKAPVTETETDRVIAASLFRDAVIRFMACFDVGMPARLDASELYGKPRTVGGVEYFRWLSALRDTWIAHRHGASRQAHAMVLLVEDTGEVVGLGGSTAGLASYVPGEDEGFIPLIQIAIAHAEKRAKELERVVADEVSAMRPSVLLRLPLAAMKAPDERSLRLGRRKFGRVNRLTRNKINIPAGAPDKSDKT